MNNRRVNRKEGILGLDEQICILYRAGRKTAAIEKELGISSARIRKAIGPDGETRRLLIERANFSCEKCHKPVKNGHAHHIRKNPLGEISALSNLLYVCSRCHRKEHFLEVRMKSMKYLKVRGKGLRARVVPEFNVDGANLTAARISAGLSMEEVARSLECHKSNISRWERGIVNPSVHAILQLIVLLREVNFVKSVRGGEDGN